jgi:hypothetical protein
MFIAPLKDSLILSARRDDTLVSEREAYLVREERMREERRG